MTSFLGTTVIKHLLTIQKAHPEATGEFTSLLSELIMELEEKEEIILNLEGKDAETFNRLFSKLSETVVEVVYSLRKKEISESTKGTINDLLSIIKNYVKPKLQKQSIENQKSIVEIAAKYAEIEERLAHAESMRIDNTMKKLEAASKAFGLLKILGLSDKS